MRGLRRGGLAARGWESPSPGRVRFAHQRFDLAHGKSLLLNAAGERHLFRRVGDGQNRAGVAERNLVLSDELLNRFRQFEQPNEVGHRRAVDADLAGEFVVGDGEAADVFLEGLSFFDGVQVASLEIFDEGEDEHLLVVEFQDADGH